MIPKNLSRQTIDHIPEKENILHGISGDALTLRQKPPQHSVMTFVGTFSQEEYGWVKYTVVYPFSSV